MSARLTFTIIALCWSSSLLAADRLTDRDIKGLVARIEDGRDRFDDALEDKFKRSLVRGAAGDVNVEDFLNDFQKSIDRLEERLKPGYAASAEAGALLRQASAIHRFYREQPAGSRGESEWNRLEADLKTLAHAYGSDFPLPETGSVNRISDQELADAIDAVASAGDRLKKSLDSDLKKDATIHKSARQAAVEEADRFAKDAKALKDRVEDGEPSSAEAEGLLALAAKVQTFLGDHQVPASAGIWASVRPQLSRIAAAYGSRREKPAP